MVIPSFMRQFSLRLRMLGAIGIVLGLLVVVGGAGLRGMRALQSLSEEFATHAFQETVELSGLRVALADLSRHEKDMVIHCESPEQLSLANMHWEKTQADILRLVASLQDGASDENHAALQRLSTRLKAYAEAVVPVLGNIKAGGYDSATVANRMLERAHGEYGGMRADLQQIQALIARDAAAVQAAEVATAQRTMQWFVVAVLVAVLVVVPATLANMHSICRPLDRAQRVALAIARGDLTEQIAADGRDELTKLMRALGDMQGSLSRVVHEVRMTTDSIGVASAEIASGNQDLSMRTEQAASRLQQTASSVEQIHSTVQQSAESARQASAMAQANAEVAARGGQVVGEVVATMQEINHRSQKISDIIGVIDGIAFQTNILALNAAVEAARAGEQGRGFAVVAGEVRTLARRSAEAAKEIKGLIGASVEKVEAGTRQVAEAGATIDEIVANAGKISALINHITVAADEQSEGIGQVSAAVGQLDQMTQQNAALVEQSAAAAQSLKDQAKKLAGVVATFHLAA